MLKVRSRTAHGAIHRTENGPRNHKVLDISIRRVLHCDRGKRVVSARPDAHDLHRRIRLDHGIDSKLKLAGASTEQQGREQGCDSHFCPVALTVATSSLGSAPIHIKKSSFKQNGRGGALQAPVDALTLWRASSQQLHTQLARILPVRPKRTRCEL